MFRARLTSGDGDLQRRCSECGRKKAHRRRKQCQWWYCDACWDMWLDEKRKAFVSKAVPRLASDHGRSRRDFANHSVHIMQIGLGTYGTFLQRDAPWMRVLLKATSCRDSQNLRSIGLDPVEEIVRSLETLALRNSRNVNMSLICGAVVDDSQRSTIRVFSLPQNARRTIQKNG